SCVTDSQSDSYTYLEDSACSARRQGVDCGLKVWGSPWQPEFCDWAFNLPPGPRLKEKWAMIESDTDILITHGPPRGILDANSQRYHCGCADLLKAVRDRVKPRLHIFGHIHESYGTFSDGHTLFVNGSTCTLSYRPSNPPIVIDLPLDVNMPAQVVGQSSEKENDIYATP
ncbi:Metallo-dependent phosphatase-like protein, partial [Ochromonadaceae sp. CCMP2298]